MTNPINYTIAPGVVHRDDGCHPSVWVGDVEYVKPWHCPTYDGAMKVAQREADILAMTAHNLIKAKGYAI